MTRSRYAMFVAAMAVLMIVLSGCGDGDKGHHDHDHDKDKGKTEAGKKDGSTDDSAEWWCVEHAAPEHLCVCSKEYVDKCKAKGDWCDKHDTPNSNCFVCNPDQKEKFALMFRNKYGKEPPAQREETAEEKKR